MITLYPRNARAWMLVLGLLGGLAIVRLSSAADSAPDEYSHVSPASALRAAVASSLKLTQDWLADKDYLSATEAAQQATVLAQLTGCQNTRPTGRAKALLESCLRLTAATRAKDAERCAKLIEECQRNLAELAKDLPADQKVVVENFRPFGTNTVWMKIMDGAYTDAKSARTAKEVETLAYQLAEEANLVGHLRPEARWRQFSMDLREAALNVAGRAAKADLPTLRRELKSVYQRCEACHQGYKR